MSGEADDSSRTSDVGEVLTLVHDQIAAEKATHKTREGHHGGHDEQHGHNTLVQLIGVSILEFGIILHR